MRGLFASSAALAVLLALFCHAIAEFPEILPGDSKHTIGVKKALQKMDLKKLSEKIQQSDETAMKKKVESSSNHGLISNAASGFGSPFCEPGFTGGNCEYPICDQTNRHDHTDNPDPEKITIDFYYATNSTQFFYVYIDLTMHGQEFQLQADGEAVLNPMMHLVDSNGNIITPVFQENKPTISTYTYQYTTPGVFKVQLNSDDPAGAMLVTYNAWTYLNTELGGITYTSLEDAKKNDLPDESTTFFTNTQTLFVTSPIGLEFPGSLSTISFFTNTDTTPHSSVLLLRYGCHFMYYTAEFTCTKEGYYFARIRGYDFEGHSFVRTHSYVCELGLPPTTPAMTTGVQTTTLPGPINCQNGGVPITRPDGSQICYCRGLYTGTYCATPLCMNGGTQRSVNCLCPDGFYGSHCQHVQCVDDAGSGSLIGTPILTFVIRVRSSMANVIGQVRDAIQKLTNEIAYDPPYISKFGLVLFNNNATTATQYHNPTDLINALTQAAQTTDNSGNCSDIMYIPILEALTRFMITNKSPIYVITDGVPGDNFYAEEVNVLNSYYQAPINFIYIEPDASAECPLFDTHSPGFEPIIETSFRFSGIASFVSSVNRNLTSDLVYNHMSNTYHKSHLMFSDDQRDCANLPRYIPISIDAKFHRLAVILEGVNATIQLNQPDGTVIPFGDSFTLGYVNMLGINGLQVGTWTIAVIGQSIRTGCSVRVYAVEDPTPTTNGQDYHMVFGITPALTQDAPEVQPIIGFKQSIVAHIENYPYTNPWSVNAEIIVFTDGSVTGNGRQLVMASNGIWRDKCSYEIYFPPFYCLREGINIYFTIFVKDDRGNQIQRAGVFYCAAFSVQPQPSPGTCANGGVSTGNGTCFCQPGWTGQYCTTRQCYNNGTLNPAGFCQCPPGTGGESCEYLRCITQNDRTDFNNHNRHLLWILDVSHVNAVPLVSMGTYITELIRDIASQHKDWISVHNVIGVDSQHVYSLGTAYGGDSGAMQTIWNIATSMAANSNDTSGRIMLYEGILRSLNFLNTNSFITVFTTGAPDENNSTNVLDGYNFVLEGNHLLNVFAATDSNGNYRYGNDSDWSIVQELADITTGRLTKLQGGKFYFGMKLIPTWYSSSLVYYKTFADCSYNGSIFAPVDSFTQAVQIYLNGQGAATSTNLYVQQPNGTVSTLVSSVISDSANKFAAYDIRRPCDEGWESGGSIVPHCYYPFRVNTTWNDARQKCSDAGGFLVDDMNQSKDDLISQMTGDLKIWIGLNSLNGTWNWDRGIGNPVSPLGTFHPWNTDGSVDPNNPCVYRGTDRKWWKTGCDAVSGFYLCQKYQYTDEYTPNEINDNDLPAGRWTISFTSPGACSIVVRMQSSIQVFSGFVTHLLDDFPIPDGISNSTDNRLVTHLVGVGTVNNIPFLDRALVIDAKNASVYRAATYQYRISCSYEYLSQNFTCPNSGNVNNRFDVLHIGEDQYGLPFQRVTSGVCAAPRTTCRNGLFYNGQCYCDEYWQGVYCEVPICVNGGFLNTADNTCQCPTGFNGPQCQFDVCYNKVNATFSNDGKAFIVVVEATTQNQVAVQNFGTNLVSTLTTILSKTSNNWFNQYILVTFDANGMISKDSATDINTFSTLYNQRTATLSTNNNCNLPLYGAIAAAVNDNLPPQSVMYLITTGGSSTADMTNSGWNAFNGVATTDVMINYILINSNTCGGQNQTNSDGSTSVAEAAVSTDGNIYFVSNNQVSNFALAHLPTLYNGSVLNTPSMGFNGQQSCSELTYYFILGQNVQTVYLYIYAQFGGPSISNPDGSSTNPSTIYEDNILFIYSFSSKGQGMYTLSINDVVPCMVQIRITGGVEIYPGYISVPSTAPQVGSHLDNPTAIPTVGTNVLTLHVSNDNVDIQYARLFPTYSAMGEIQYIQLYSRFNCSYEWYSDPFVCDEAGYFITVFGLGNRGAPFARHFYTRCNGYNGTTQAPPTGLTTPMTTVPGQTTTMSKYYPVTADIVFLLDNSVSVTQAQFTDTKNFILNAFAQFNVGFGKGVQVAVFSLLGDYDQFATLITAFNGVLDYNSLSNALTNGFQAEGPNSGTGNSDLLQALRIVMGPDFKSKGYRTTINNHLIVYITTVTQPNPPSIAQAQVVLNSGDYKIMAIAYQGDGSNIATLTSLTGNAGCVLQSSSQADYTGNFAQQFTDKIFNAYQNGGNYC